MNPWTKTFAVTLAVGIALGTAIVPRTASAAIVPGRFPIPARQTVDLTGYTFGLDITDEHRLPNAWDIIPGNGVFGPSLQRRHFTPYALTITAQAADGSFVGTLKAVSNGAVQNVTGSVRMAVLSGSGIAINWKTADGLMQFQGALQLENGSGSRAFVAGTYNLSIDGPFPFCGDGELPPPPVH